MELGNQMKKYRGELSLSQDALAEKIYVSRQTISNWETGKSYPDVNSLTDDDVRRYMPIPYREVTLNPVLKDARTLKAE